MASQSASRMEFNYVLGCAAGRLAYVALDGWLILII